jgi:hypothetical protein
MKMLLRTWIVLSIWAGLSGCDLLGIQTPEKITANRDAEGRAVGAACRHAGRALEDCYALNKRADKAAVFAGWRDMNDYMRENKIKEVAPEMSPKIAPLIEETEEESGNEVTPAKKASAPPRT